MVAHFVQLTETYAIEEAKFRLDQGKRLSLVATIALLVTRKLIALIDSSFSLGHNIEKAKEVDH